MDNCYTLIFNCLDKIYLLNSNWLMLKTADASDNYHKSETAVFLSLYMCDTSVIFKK